MKLGQESYKNIIENLHDGLYFVDKNRVITYWNKAAEKISGYSADEVIGRSCSDNILCHVDGDGNNLCTSTCALASTIADNIPRESEIYMHHKDGHRIPVSVRISALVDSNGKTIGGIELFTDISNREANTLKIKELEKMAFLDKLTQLANRNYIEREIQVRFEEIRRLNFSFGILFMDIDHFKEFNDKYGHHVGDRVLKFVAKTLSASSRPFDFYGRWGGEEFIGVIHNISESHLKNLGERVRELVANSYILAEDKQPLKVNISIGATMANAGESIETLIKRADEILYESKAAGRNCLTFG